MVFEKTRLVSSALFVLVILLYVGLLLVGPRIDDADQQEYCVHNVHLPGPFGLSVNCDSPEFLQVAANPSRLLEPGSVRQSRPGLPVAAHVVSQPFVVVWNVLVSNYFKDVAESGRPERGQDLEQKIEQTLPYFVGYLVLNVLLLYAALRLYNVCWGVRSGVFSEASLKNPASWFGLCLVFNVITQESIWSPHTQLFNILVPLVCLYGFLLSFEGLQNIRALLVLSVVSGFGMLCYGSFIVLVPAVALGFFLQGTSPFLDRNDAWKKLGVVAGMLAVVALPSLLWGAYVVTTTGSFYSHEVAVYHQVVWIREVYQAHGLLAVLGKFIHHLVAMYNGAWFHGWWLLPLAAIVLGLLRMLPADAEKSPMKSPMIGIGLGGVLVSALFAIFFAAVGYTPLRLAYSVLPPLIVLLGYMIGRLWSRLSARHRRVMVRLTMLSMYAMALYFVIKEPPNL